MAGKGRRLRIAGTPKHTQPAISARPPAGVTPGSGTPPKNP